MRTARARVGILVLDAAGGRTARPSALLAAALARGHRVEVLAVRRAGDPASGAPGSRVVPAGGDERWTAADDEAAGGLLTRARLDLVVTTSAGTLAAAARLLPSRVRVLHVHHRLEPSAIDEALLQAHAGRAALVAAPDEDAAAALAALLGAGGPPVAVAPPLHRPLPDPVRRSAPGAAPLRPPEFGHLLLCWAAPGSDQQVLQVLKAFASLAAEHDDWRLRVAGRGPQHREVAGLVRRLGLEGRVDLVPRAGDPAAEWSRAAVGVSAARSTPWEAPAADAAAAGVPYVCYDVSGGTRALVRHEKTGLLAAPDVTASLAAALRRVAGDPGLRAELADGARAHGTLLAAEGPPAWASLVARALGHAGDPVSSTAPASAPAALRSLTPAAARTAALRTLVAAARAAGVRCWVLPRPFPEMVRFVVAETDGRRLLDALAAAEAPGWLEARLAATAARTVRRGSVADVSRWAAAGAVGRLELGPPDCVGERPTHLVEGSAVALELWPRDAVGDLIAPGHNGLLHRLPAGAATTRTDVDGVAVDVPVPFDRPTTWDVTHPVDVVCTWVDGDDDEWQAARAARLVALGRQPDSRAAGRARYADREELRWALRSLHLHAPWVRTIHLVTAGQRPSWLADHPRVRLVDHQEILPPEVLPTFNSHAIETGLHRVPGLAEHFVYLNDDVVLGRPLGAGTFFGPGGTFATFAGSAALGLPAPDDAAYLQAGFANRELLLKNFGTVATRQLLHAPHPHRVSVLEEVESRYAEALARTAASPFRGPGDVSLLSSLAQQHGLRTGTAHVAALEVAYLDLGRSTLPAQLLRLLRARDVDAMCFADAHDFAFDRAETEARLRAFCEQYLPAPAPWER